METQIVPCRAEISDRFPVASFAVNVPPARFFEVACATDPRLFHSDWRRYRSPGNFYSSRSEGLMRAPGGQTAWFIPPEQLRRFAGSPRIFYALATYENTYGGAPEFTISPQMLERVPSIALAADFTGRGLDRSRLGAPAPQPDAYGAVSPATLTWGGDDALAAQRAAEAPPSGGYDDGYPDTLWKSEPNGDEAPAAAAGLGEYAFELGADCRDAEDDPPAAAMEHGGEPHPEEYEAGEGDEYAGGASAGLYDDPGAAELPEDGEGYDHAEAAAVPDDEGYDEAGGYGEPQAAEEEEPWTGEGYGSVHDDAEEEGEGEDDEETYGGYEDAAALYGAVGGPDGADAAHADPALYGGSDGGVAVADAPPETEAYPGAPEAEGLGGRDVAYSEEEPEEEPLPVGRAAQALAVVPLDIPEKVRILRVVAVAESGRDGYSAVNPDNEYNDPRHPAYRRYHIGLSWGFIQFTQRSGALGRVLRAILARERALGAALPEAHRFERLFGPHWQALLEVTTAGDPEARVAEVGGKPLWHPEWTERFRAAGRVPHVSYAQNEVAITDYADPNLRFAAWLGFDDARALAMLWDRCIHMGNGGGRSWVMRACGPVRTDEDRRTALAALGHADLRAFQRSQAPELEEDGRWGPRTHAAMTAALRALGARSPVAVPTRDAMLQRMVDAARSTRFAARVAALHANRTDFDDATTYVPG